MTERKLQIKTILMALSKDKSELVREAVAENPNTSPAVLTSLATDKDIQVRMAVAAHKNTP